MLQKSLIRRLDLITLQLFVAVHEEGTLTRAAAREADRGVGGEQASDGVGGGAGHQPRSCVRPKA